ncbi:amidohydrolase [Streptacidiphilus sp. EB129]|uniref:amidohydrolase n=1 Tax=Streptacidiphilus sp. EB129 TaxID=3156262 RepID=UPI003516C0E7
MEVSQSSDGASASPSSPASSPASGPISLSARVRELVPELVEIRRDLHRHPELGRQELRTTALLKARLERAGLSPRVLPGGTGLICDIRPDRADIRADRAAPDAPLLAFRADIDALPIDDAKPASVPYRSTVPGRAHACGHDVHTTVVLGLALVLARAARERRLARPVRLIFQPAEEVMPGGALDVIEAGGMDGVERIFAVHCDPKVEVGRIGLRVGAITSACDRLVLSLDGPGGHTARPHLTTDLVAAIARTAAELPGALGRRMDPRWGVSLVWGRIASGSAANVIPQHAELEGTVRCLELAGWYEAPGAIEELVGQIAETCRAKWVLDYHRGVPPVVNEAVSVEMFRAAMDAGLGPGRVEGTEQSLGGEDFSWYLEKVPGALARLGVRGPAETGSRDLHQGSFDVDEGAIGVGVELFSALALG